METCFIFAVLILQDPEDYGEQYTKLFLFQINTNICTCVIYHVNSCSLS